VPQPFVSTPRVHARPLCSHKGPAEAPRTLRAWLYNHRLAIAANTACSLQMLQWTQDDVLYLRTLNVLAISFFTVYNLSMRAWIYIGWDSLYTIINLTQIARLLRDRRGVDMSPWERSLHEGVFARALGERHALALIRAAEPERVLQAGEAVSDATREDAGGVVGVVISGMLSVEVGGAPVATIGRFGWYGHHRLLQRDGPRHGLQGAATRMCALEPTQVIEWRADTLRSFLSGEAAVDRGLQTLWNRDLTQRLSNMGGGHRRLQLDAYAGALRAVAVGGAFGEAQAELLWDLRERYHIDQATHERCCDELEPVLPDRIAGAMRSMRPAAALQRTASESVQHLLTSAHAPILRRWSDHP